VLSQRTVLVIVIERYQKTPDQEIDYDYAREHGQLEIHITIGYFKELRLEHIYPDIQAERG
jgi:hypothetical protein